MKVRNGFVSNSSSSSFILSLKEVPTSMEHLKSILKVDDCLTVSHWDDYYDTNIVVTRIYNDMMEEINGNRLVTNISDLTQLSDRFKGGLQYYYSQYQEFIQPNDLERYNEIKIELDLIDDEQTKLYRSKGWDSVEMKKLRQEFDTSADEAIKLIMKGVSKKVEDDVLFMEIEYSDNDGEICSLIEHGGILDPITVIRFNNH